jgi:glycosyltransferase involved in cell wall biosynthesis
MRLLFVADGRSPIALNWINHFIDRGDEVHLVSTFASKPDPRLASFTFIPVAFSELKSSDIAAIAGRSSRSVLRVGRMSVRLRTLVRQWLGPITLTAATSHLKSVMTEISPDLVHAMRIPYEGMLAALAVGQAATKNVADSLPYHTPLLISVWGNDFTLHAPATPLMRHYTRLALECADALHADCQRDVRLARQWGFSASKPAVVLPGAGGVQSELFFPPPIPVAEPVVINPRGFRAYVNNAAFFQAIPKVLSIHPEARFLCTTMEHEPQAQRWVDELGIRDNVELLPVQTRPQMAGLFRRSRVAVSPSNHDGTPNTLLEAMACGCLPVAGDLESLREWITPELNGLLVDPNDPEALATAIQRALTQDDLQEQARLINIDLIAERAEHRAVMQRASVFYQVLLERKD